MAPRPTPDHRLQRLASAFTPEWVAAQRWYRGKSRTLTRVELLDASQIDESAGWLVVLEATDAVGARARYLVPVVLVGDLFSEPRDGDGVWSAIAGLMLGGGELAGARGQWQFSPTNAGSELLPGGAAALASAAERRLEVQQSNTSVALGESLMLKLYRLVEPGTNPEVEVNAFLTEVGFREAPLLAGSAIYLLDGEQHSAAMLQQLVPSAGDAWSWVLDRLSVEPEGPAEALRGVEQIGRLTAAMHEALASRPVTPGFPSRLATQEELSEWSTGAKRQLRDAVDVLDDALRPRLANLVPRITAGLAAIQQSGAVRVSRIHGDYHLGQLLRTDDAFVVIDFEGEPARTLAERRASASPLRDLAGMLRSLDYAAHATVGRDPSSGGRSQWLGAARAALLEGYGGLRPDQAPLLAAFELEKACYEVVYEANNRPDWTWLPLGALERLAAR
ncbi:MAG: phosphotransferase [Chloroflexi bacterium]|nr:phosphotransferase [Chloroflexota bacterium]